MFVDGKAEAQKLANGDLEVECRHTLKTAC